MKEDAVHGKISDGRMLSAQRKNDLNLCPSKLLSRKEKKQEVLQSKKIEFDKGSDVQEDNTNLDKIGTDRVSTQLINADKYVEDRMVGHTVVSGRTLYRVS